MSHFQYSTARYDPPPAGSAPGSVPYPIPHGPASQPPPGLQPPGTFPPGGGPPGPFSALPGGFPFPVPPVLHRPNGATAAVAMPIPMPIPMPGALPQQAPGSIPVPNEASASPQPADAQPVIALKSSFLTDSSLRPSTVDEQLRTIFVGSIPAELDDFWLGRLLKAAGTLVGWTRIKDALEKSKDAALAEYEDMESLGIAIEVLSDMEIPVVEIEEGEEVEDESQADRKAAKLMIKYSDKTNSLLEQQNLDSLAEALNSARKAVSDSLEVWKDPAKRAEEREKAVNENEENSEDRNVVRIAAGGDDDLTDLPPEQRAVVVREIAAFRERANQRERERIKREEEIERQRLERIQAEKRRTTAASASPAPPSMPAKMRERANGYADPVAFNKGSAREEEDLSGLGPDADTLSDEALEERRREKREDDLEAKFIERERRYLREERARISNAEREMHREEDDQKAYIHHRNSMFKLLAEWDDDREEQRRLEEYYRDRSTWLRNRAVFRSREFEADERDAAIERANQPEPEKKLDAAALADSFLEQQAAELDLLGGSREPTPSRFGAVETRKEELRRDAGPIRMAFKKEEASRSMADNKPITIGVSQPKAAASGFKLALGAKKPEAGVKKPEKKAFIDDEDEGTESKRRKLIPLSYDKIEDRK
ncbi:hypothetical protein V1506DRAFT_564220 [Lipomyces tetrasporus]